MSSFQDFKGSNSRVRRPYESVLQLVETYLVSECVNEMRADFKQTTEADLLKTIKPIDPFFTPLEEKVQEALKKQREVVVKFKEKGDDDKYVEAMVKLAKLTRNVSELEEHKKQLIEAYTKACKLCQFEPFRVCILFYAIKDMFVYDFYGQPSLSQDDYKQNDYLDQSKGSYEAYSHHNLLFHTIHVFSQAIEQALAKKQLGVELSVISALLHDYGKSSGIIQEVDTFPNQKRNEQVRNHWTYSSNYVYFILRNKVKKIAYSRLGSNWEQEHSDEVEEDFKKIQRNVAYHHAVAEDKYYTDSVAFVKTADAKAREKEKDFYFNEYLPWEEDIRNRVIESLIDSENR